MSFLDRREAPTAKWKHFNFKCTSIQSNNCLPSFASGGNTSVENNPQQDGDDGTSFFGHQGEIFLYPLKGNWKK